MKSERGNSKQRNANSGSVRIMRSFKAMTGFIALTEHQKAEGYSVLRLQTYTCGLSPAEVKRTMRETNIKRTLSLEAGIYNESRGKQR
jgi:hypothetical protein